VWKQSLGVALAALAFTLAVLPASAATKVFLLAGQSNMSGVGGYTGFIHDSPPWSDPPYNRADKPCPEPYRSPLSAVKFWNYGYGKKPADFVNDPLVGDGWIDLQPGFGHRADQFGPELGFGHRLHQLFPKDDIYLIKSAYGGTNLAQQWNPNPKTMGPRYKQFHERVYAALANLKKAGRKPKIVGMIWMQGEDDSTSLPMAKDYEKNLKNLIATVRAEFKAPEMKFVIGRITDMGKLWAATPDSIRLVRTAQEKVPAMVGNAAWFNTDDLQWAYYGHYGTKGQIELGIRFANQFAPPAKAGSRAAKPSGK
jgi:hypothetical protein